MVMLPVPMMFQPSGFLVTTSEDVSPIGFYSNESAIVRPLGPFGSISPAEYLGAPVLDTFFQGSSAFVFSIQAKYENFPYGTVSAIVVETAAGLHELVVNVCTVDSLNYPAGDPGISFGIIPTGVPESEPWAAGESYRIKLIRGVPTPPSAISGTTSVTIGVLLGSLVAGFSTVGWTTGSTSPTAISGNDILYIRILDDGATAQLQIRLSGAHALNSFDRVVVEGLGTFYTEDVGFWGAYSDLGYTFWNWETGDNPWLALEGQTRTVEFVA